VSLPAAMNAGQAGNCLHGGQGEGFVSAVASPKRGSESAGLSATTCVLSNTESRRWRYGGYSALWKALHKADYAKYPIMESGWSELVPSADWQ